MPTLREKFTGCIAASWIGSAMGAAVEGWPSERTRQTYGVLDRLVGYCHYRGRNPTDWQRPAGTTEDGIERQRLMATAIIEKQDRILAHDLVRVWLRDLDPAKMAWKQEEFDIALLRLAREGVPPAELGGFWLYPNVVSLARASHPLGLINAGDPQGAADDTFEIGRIYAGPSAFGTRWAALYNAAIAAACRPDATADGVLAVALRFAAYRAEAGRLYAGYDTIKREVDRALDLAARCTEPGALREQFDKIYFGGHYFNYGQSQANEIVSKGLAVFAVTRGDPKSAIIAAVNFGRDTDCLAAVAGGLAGALEGSAGLPGEWIEQVDQATRQDPYTNCKRTISQTADGLLAAFLERKRRLEQWLAAMGKGGFLA